MVSKVLGLGNIRIMVRCVLLRVIVMVTVNSTPKTLKPTLYCNQTSWSIEKSRWVKLLGGKKHASRTILAIYSGDMFTDVYNTRRSFAR